MRSAVAWRRLDVRTELVVSATSSRPPFLLPLSSPLTSHLSPPYRLLCTFSFFFIFSLLVPLSPHLTLTSQFLHGLDISFFPLEDLPPPRPYLPASARGNPQLLFRQSACHNNRAHIAETAHIWLTDSPSISGMLKLLSWPRNFLIPWHVVVVSTGNRSSVRSAQLSCASWLETVQGLADVSRLNQVVMGSRVG